MYSSAVLAAVLASTASSSLAIPLRPSHFPILPARDATDASGAISAGAVKDVVDIGNGIINGVDGIKNLFSRYFFAFV